MKNKGLLLIVAVLLFATSACVKFQAQLGYDANLQNVAWDITKTLIATSEDLFYDNETVLIASVVNIDNLEESSTFGRMFSGYIASWLNGNGYTIVEMKLRDSVYLQKKNGTFFLSRDVQNLSKEHNAVAVIVGTYSIGRNVCYLSMRLIRADDNVVLSSVDTKIPLGTETSHLLGTARY